MWMMPLHLHVNQKSDYDDDDDIPSLKKIGKKMPQIESENKFLTSIKGYNSVLICQNLPICNPRKPLHNIDSHTKFEENR